MVKITIMNEIATALLSDTANDVDALKANPKDYLASRLDINVADEVTLSVAENSDSMIHLALPYYDGLDNLEAKAASIAELEQATGGLFRYSANPWDIKK